MTKIKFTFKIVVLMQHEFPVNLIINIRLNRLAGLGFKWSHSDFRLNYTTSVLSSDARIMSVFASFQEAFLIMLLEY